MSPIYEVSFARRDVRSFSRADPNLDGYPRSASPAHVSRSPRRGHTDSPVAPPWASSRCRQTDSRSGLLNTTQASRRSSRFRGLLSGVNGELLGYSEAGTDFEGPEVSKWWAMQGSNLRPSVCKTTDLPAEASPQACSFVAGLLSRRSLDLLSRYQKMPRIGVKRGQIEAGGR